MIIYIDLLFIINFCVDFIVLTLTCATESVNLGRRFFGAFIGSIYACLVCFDVPEVIFCFGIKILVLFIMCLVCFFPCDVKRLFTKTLAAFSVSAFFSGLIYAVEVFFFSESTKPKGELLIALGISIGYALIKCFFSSVKREVTKGRIRVKISYNGNTASFFGIYDSANMLKEPILGYPVIVADFSVIQTLFPQIRSANELCELVNVQDFKIIPYKTVANSGVIYGFVPEKLIIDKREIKNVIVAAAPEKISEEILLNAILI